MNREIKFRWFDKEENEMIDWNQISPLSQEDFTGETELIPMQFTGLKDCNSKEIYEGDVCKYLFDETPFSDEPNLSNYKEKTGVVKLVNFMWVFESETNDFLGSGCISNIEIIGNIYDQPQ